MKIIGLSGSGYRKLNAFEMKFGEKGLVPIVGDNGQGKTSIIDFLCWMIKGNKTLNPDVINWNNDKMEGELILDKYKIERVHTKKSNRLKVTNLETGEPEKGEVQNFLDTFINELTFNPRPFLDQNNLGKFKFLMDMLGIDFTALDKRLTILEDRRLETGRKRDKYGDLDKDAPEKVERVDVQKLLAERKKIEEKNASNRAGYDKAKNAELEEIEKFNKEQREKASAIRQKEDAIKICTQHIDEHKIKIEELEKQLQQLKAKLHQHQENYKELVNEKGQLLPPEPEKPLKTSLPAFEPLSTDDIDKQIQEANAFNVKADAYERWQEKKKEKQALADEYRAYDSEIKEIREEKLKILREADTGVKGMEIREDGVYYNNIHSDNWSDAQSLRIAAELALSRIDREKQIEAVFIDRFESYGKKLREDFQEWCKGEKIHALVTIVRDDKPDDLESYFWIEEGDVQYIEEGKLIDNKDYAEARYDE